MKFVVLLPLFAALLVAGCGEKSSSEDSESACESAGPSGDMEVSKEVSEFADQLSDFRTKAEQGDAEAQYNLGLMYDKGEGVLEDSVTAYAWCNIAAVNGHELAKSQKLNLAKNMTPEQIAKGQELSKEMVKKNPELLN